MHFDADDPVGLVVVENDVLGRFGVGEALGGEEDFDAGEAVGGVIVEGDAVVKVFGGHGCFFEADV